MLKKIGKIFLFICPFAIYAIFAIWRLDEIPGEWYGDITALNYQVTQIMSGRPFLQYVCASGPLYGYVIWPFVAVFGNTYIVYKAASVFVGAIGILMIFLLAGSTKDKRIQFLTSLVGVMTFWYISWARLGSTPVMLEPIITALSVYFIVKYYWDDRILYLVVAGLLSSLALLVYPGVFLTPVVVGLLFIWIKRKQLFTPKTFIHSGILVISILPITLLFLYITTSQRGNFLSSGGYIGAKIWPVFHKDPVFMIAKFLTNFEKTYIAFFGTGDSVFRVNVPYSPHLDILSGVLMLLGIVYWCGRNKQYFLPFILLPIFIIPLPSMSPTLPDGEIPSMTRTYGMTPFIFLLIAGGINFVSGNISRINRKAAIVITVLFFAVILFLNAKKYFIDYPKTLPSHNSPYGKIIAKFINGFDAQTAIWMTDCCWGDWGQPESESIYFALKYRKGRENILYNNRITDCSGINRKSDNVIILNPANTFNIQKFRSCFPQAVGQMHQDQYGQQVFYSILIPRNQFDN